MKNLVYIIAFALVSCTTVRYVEVPTVKTEYRDRTSIDTLIRNDSIIIREKGDTILIEKYEYLYKTKEVKDTVHIADTITVVSVKEEIKEVNKLKDWQVVLMILGGVFLSFVVYKLINIFKR